MTVTVKKVGGSLAVIIPSSVAREARLVEGTTLDISAAADGVMMRKRGRRPRRSMASLVKQIDPAAYARRNAEFSADRPVGMVGGHWLDGLTRDRSASLGASHFVPFRNMSREM
jgi:antitoxin component of MazEF toxin-antitoxin module